jgi:phospholipid transport system transporter-binding protein
MPSADPAAGAPPSLRREAETLHFQGDLVVSAIAGLWKPALALLAGVRRFDLAGVGRVDSAGVALLAELAQRAGAVAIEGDPMGLASLRAAYRLTPALGYAT